MKFPLVLGWCCVAVTIPQLYPCDLCAVYNANAARGEGSTGFHLALAEQFTHSGTLQEDGSKVSNPIGQYRDSSITSLIAGYNFHPRFGVSLNVPYIHRSFKRAEGFEVERGTESGLGDMALVGRWMVLSKPEHDHSYSVSLLGGVEFPTGSASRLREEVNEMEGPGAPPSGVHGNDLALGSGSFDGIVGVSASGQWRRLVFATDAQYFIRTRGEFGYQFGNELSVSGGPGVYLWFDEAKTFAVHGHASYESKAHDSVDGVNRDDGIVIAWYAGPALTMTWGERFSATLNVDLPLHIANRGVQAVPDYRVRGGLAWHF
jgi:hypothetical protein